ncbi:fibronectin type III domain protein [Cooperia oncophora]
MNISVPKHAPTDVEVFQEGDNVLVDFEPLPLSKIPGQDAGCEVRVCENPDVITSCDVRSVPPRTPTAEFRSLQPHSTYYVAVACKTRAGMGPQSPWLTFTTGKLETKKPRKTTTTVTTTTTAPEPVNVSQKLCRSNFQNHIV